MRIKQRPEDFSVKESYRYDEVETGRYRVYMMDKQKLSTFDALSRLREKFGLKPGAISYCGLKDKQGRTEQLIAVDGKDIDLQEPDLRLKFLGHTDRPLSAANTVADWTRWRPMRRCTACRSDPTSRRTSRHGSPPTRSGWAR